MGNWITQVYLKMAIETDMMVVPVAEEMYRDNSAALSGFCRSLMM